MDLTQFEDAESEFEIGFWISQSQVSENRDRKIEKRQKVNSSEFLILYMVNLSRNEPNSVLESNHLLRSDPL